MQTLWLTWLQDGNKLYCKLQINCHTAQRVIENVPPGATLKSKTSEQPPVDHRSQYVYFEVGHTGNTIAESSTVKAGQVVTVGSSIACISNQSLDPWR